MAGSAAMMRKGSAGVLFLLGADLAYTVYSGTNSSPQTTDVFGDEARLGSLWKYVRIGGAVTFILIAFASWLERSPWPLIGGGFAGGMMHLLYRHAAKSARARHAPHGGEKQPSRESVNAHDYAAMPANLNVDHQQGAGEPPAMGEQLQASLYTRP